MMAIYDFHVHSPGQTQDKTRIQINKEVFLKTDNQSDNKQLWTFFILTYFISWIFWISAALSGQEVTKSIWMLPYILGGFGPSIAGILLMTRYNSKPQRRDFWKRLLGFKRISMKWYLIIFLVFPAVFGFSILLNALLGQEMPGFNAVVGIIANPLSLLGIIIAGLITGPLAEEPGWRGFALDRLQNKWSPLLSSLILGTVWWVWHLSLFFMKGTTQYQWGFGSVYFWMFFLAIFPLTIILTWVYNRTNRSILAAVLIHFMYNFTLGLVYPFSSNFIIFETGFLWIAAVVVVILSDQSKQSSSISIQV